MTESQKKEFINLGAAVGSVCHILQEQGFDDAQIVIILCGALEIAKVSKHYQDVEKQNQQAMLHYLTPQGGKGH